MCSKCLFAEVKFVLLFQFASHKLFQHSKCKPEYIFAKGCVEHSFDSMLIRVASIVAKWLKT